MKVSSTWISVCVTLGLLAGTAGSAAAASITMEMGGTITLVNNQSGYYPDLQPGDSWSISYTFESTTPNSNSPDPQWGAYQDYNATGTFMLDGSSHPFDLSRHLSIYVDNDNPYGQYDSYSVQPFIDTTSFDNSPDYTHFVLNIYDYTSAVFSDTGLPLAPIGMDYFDDSNMQFYADSFEIQGIVTYWTPEPATALLLLAAFPLLRRRRITSSYQANRSS